MVGARKIYQANPLWICETCIIGQKEKMLQNHEKYTHGD
jgi:hypothetical protein